MSGARAIWGACQLVADNLRDPVEIARRAGFGDLGRVPAPRIINRARRIVDARRRELQFGAIAVFLLDALSPRGDRLRCSRHFSHP
jgi:hypothetical protein